MSAFETLQPRHDGAPWLLPCRGLFLVIDNTIWGRSNTVRFLYAQMKLIGYDDWNVLLLAADGPGPRTPVALAGPSPGNGSRVVSAGHDQARGSNGSGAMSSRLQSIRK